MKTQYDKYWYFRTAADEDDDAGSSASTMISLDQITGILPTTTTAITMYFKQHTGSGDTVVEDGGNRNGYVVLNVTAGQTENVMRALVSDINAGPRGKSSGVTTVADDSITDQDGTTRAAVYIHPGITSCGAIALR